MRRAGKGVACLLAFRRFCSLPSVILLEGDAFAEDNFAKIRSDPKWVLESMQGDVESFYMENGPGKQDNLAAWKPLSATVHHLTCTHNLKVLGWSRHPTDTSKVVYSLLNDAETRSTPTTVLPHYQLDRVSESWKKNGPPLYFSDAQGHSATHRAGVEFSKQEKEAHAEYDPAVEPAAFARCSLPELFAIVASSEDSWEAIASTPRGVLLNYISEAQKLQATEKALYKGSSPLAVLLNLLVGKYGCKIDSQKVTNNDLKKITFILENAQL